MKKLVLLSIVFIGLSVWQSSIVNAQGVGINPSGNPPDNSAMLDVSATDKGLLIPRLTTVQRDAITNPADGLIIFNTDMGCFNYYWTNTWYNWCGTPPAGSIAFLDCANAVNNGTLTSGVAASGVNSFIAYTGSNGGPHNGQTVISTGVTGLTATLAAGSFASGAGTLIYTITGTPSGAGTASFAIIIGGQSCTLTRTVAAPPFTCGASTVTFTYKSSSVAYETILSTTGECWLDRNLGASQAATSSTDANSYGDLFQWGRLDDLHQNRTSGTTTIQSSTDQPGHGNFIYSSVDWRNPQNNNLWQGVNGINNPCPSGWHVPSQAEWTAEGITDPADAYSKLKLPMAGFRASGNGSLNSVGSKGYYWSRGLNGIYARFLLFENGTAEVNSGNDRAFGFSVRCIMD